MALLLVQAAFRQKALDHWHVGGIVEFDWIPLRRIAHHRSYWQTEVKEAQLLKSFELLEKGRGGSDVLLQGLSTVGVEPKVQEYRHRLELSLQREVGNDSLREVKRSTVAVEHDRCAAHPPVSFVFLKMGEGRRTAAQRWSCYFKTWIIVESLHQTRSQPSGRQRSITLQIDDELRIAVELVNRICATLGPISAIGRGHHDLAAEASDLVRYAIVISGYPHPTAALNLRSALPAALDQGFRYAARASKLDERLARKARRRKSGGYQDNKIGQLT